MRGFGRSMVLIGLLFLSACATRGEYSGLEKINRAEFIGSPFTKYLASHYQSFANGLGGGGVGDHFTRKAMASADGMIVMPEVIEDWQLSEAPTIEMATARAKLVGALENGGREFFPERAALAQATFDCWIKQQEGFTVNGVTCKSRFNMAMQGLNIAMSNNTPNDLEGSWMNAGNPAQPNSNNDGGDFPAPIGNDIDGMPKGPLASTAQAQFLTFFDWNEYNLSTSSHDVLDAIAYEIKERNDVKRVKVTGHTDTSGSESYNKKLSLKRANAVREGLSARGVPARKITTIGRGEVEPMIKTPDNVREPSNRRAEINLE